MYVDDESVNKLEDLLQKVQEFLDTAMFKFNDSLDKKYESYKLLVDYVYQSSQILEKVDPFL